MTFFSLGSGSCGNCYYISTDTDAIIIDCGVGIRRFKKHMMEYGMKVGKVRGILITHDHSDHIKATGKISKGYRIPVYATEAVHKGMERSWQNPAKVPAENKRIINFGESFTIGPFTITPFPVPHDATENTGYHIVTGNIRFTLMTDIGAATEDIKHYISISTHLVMESNYDVDMLTNGHYPAILKQRISSGHGHLSNKIAADTLSEHMSPDLKHVWLCHLSEENNHPEVARSTMEEALKQHGIDIGKDLSLDVLRRKIPSGPYQL